VLLAVVNLFGITTALIHFPLGNADPMNLNRMAYGE